MSETGVVGGGGFKVKAKSMIDVPYNRKNNWHIQEMNALNAV